MKNFAKNNRYTVMLFVWMAAVLLFFTITKASTLWQVSTWQGIVMQFPEFGVMTIGVMFPFITGNIDMSFVALGDFATLIMAKYLNAHWVDGTSTGSPMSYIMTGILIAMIICIAGGIINGLLITKLGIPAVMATIAMQLVWQGLSIALTNGNTVSGLPELYTEIGHSNVLGFLPYPLFIFIIMAVISGLLLKFTVFGEKLYMCGTNVKACHYSAINTDRVITVSFVLCAVWSCVGALLMVSTMASAKADYGTSYVMRVILILVLAGVLPDGGTGKIHDVVLSVIIVQIIGSGVNMFSNLNAYYANLIWGALLLLVLILSTKMGADGFHFKKKKAAKAA